MRGNRVILSAVALFTVFVCGARAADTTEDVEFRAAVDGTLQRYVIIVPEGFAAAKPRAALIALHGHGSDRWQFVKNARDECRAARDAAAARSMLFVSPDYRARTSWMGPKAEADMVQIIGELKEKHRVEKVVICGGSMGGTAVLTFAALHPELVDGVVSMNGTANLVDYANFPDAIAESFGGTKTKVPDEYRKRSAEFFPEKFTMPISATTGGKDLSVPPKSVLRLMDAIRPKNADVLLIHRTDGGHDTKYDDAAKAFDFVLAKALAPVAPPKPVKVEKTDGAWRLIRGGEPYVIKGVGGTGDRTLLARCGGNSVRTWGTDDLKPILDDCQRLGLTVTVGIWLGHERHGFDYNDADQVAKQFETARAAILKYRDHPAVLMWGIGNEMEGYEAGANAAIWSAINNIASMAKSLDPNHPTMTVVAEIGGDRVKNIHRLCPDIDIVGINSYGGLSSLPGRYRKAGGTKPYVVTEFGPPGTWESKKNAWGAVPEPTSTEKAGFYRRGYEQGVTGSQGLCLGSYAFVWGHKQEATATWFGLLLPDGGRLGAVDALQELWTGKPPDNRCPRIDSLRIDGADQVEPGATLRATLAASDPEKDRLDVTWVLQAEPLEFGVGGDEEAAPPTFPDAIARGDATGADVTMPKDGGGYRLFAFVRDGKGGAAVANVLLLVKGPVVPPKVRKAALPLVLDDESGKPPYLPTGWMGNTKGLKLDAASTDQPHAGKTCVRIDFTPADGWGGIVWQSPANDWGDRPGGWDLTGAKTLSFHARGASGGEVLSVEFGLLGKDKKYSDSGRGKLEKITLTPEWTRYEIKLDGQDLGRIKTGFAVIVAGQGKPVTAYFDQILYAE